jgi:glycosyltransferase involved in cell wall biosynthesis
MRYAYIKNGDAADQVRRLVPFDRPPDGSGPDAFIAEFLHANSAEDILVLSRSDRGDSCHFRAVRAQTFAISRYPFGRYLGAWLGALRIGARLLRWRPQRILCGCSGEMLLIAVIVARILRVPCIHSRHNEFSERRGIRRVGTLVDRFATRRCDAIVCHGPFLARQVALLGFPARRTFQFEVDLRAFVAAPDGAKPPPDVVRFVAGLDAVFAFVGRIQADKGVFDLLDAFAGLAGAHRQIGLIYVGDGKDMPHLSRKAGSLPGARNVLLLGRLPHAQLPSIMRTIAAVVTPTRPEFPEGRCMTVLEALVHGVPVIAPNFGPFPFAIQHEVSGLLYAPGSATALRGSMESILVRPALLESLRRGAAEAGRELLTAYRSFAWAVDAAFRSTNR